MDRNDKTRHVLRGMYAHASELCQILKSETNELYFIKFPFVRRLWFLMARLEKVQKR